MAEEDWEQRYQALERRCATQRQRAGRDLVAFGLGAAVTGGVIAGLNFWRRRQAEANGDTAIAGGDNGDHGNHGNGVGNGNEPKKAKIKPGVIRPHRPKPPPPGAMAPGDS